MVSLLCDLWYVMEPVLVLNAKATEHSLHREGFGRLKHMDVAYLWRQDEVTSKILGSRVRNTWQISAPMHSAKQVSRNTPLVNVHMDEES